MGYIKTYAHIERSKIYILKNYEYGVWLSKGEIVGVFSSREKCIDYVKKIIRNNGLIKTDDAYGGIYQNPEYPIEMYFQIESHEVDREYGEVSYVGYSSATTNID